MVLRNWESVPRGRVRFALYEARMRRGRSKTIVSPKIARELEKASAAMRKKYPKWGKMSEILEREAESIEEFSPAVWGKEV